MDKYITANDVSLDKGNKQSTMRASIGGLEVVRNGLRPPLRRGHGTRDQREEKERVKKEEEHLRQRKHSRRAQGWARCCLWLKCGSWMEMAGDATGDSGEGQRGQLGRMQRPRKLGWGGGERPTC